MGKRKKVLGNKGNLDDIPFAILTIIGFVITFFLVFNVLDNFNTNIQNTNTTVINESTEAKVFLATYETRYVRAWDYGFTFLLIFLPLFSFLAAKRIPVSPANMIIAFFVIGFFVLVAMIATNIYGGFQDNATFVTFEANTFFIPLIMPHLVYWVMIYTFVVLIGLFSKREGAL